MTINYYLDKPTATTETAIYLFLRSGGKKLKFNTGYRIHPKDWDVKKQKVKKNFTSSPDFNLYLTTLKSDVQKALITMATTGSNSLEEVKEPIATIVDGKGFKEDKVDFLEAFGFFLETYRVTRHKATVSMFETLLGHLKGYASSKRLKLSFPAIDHRFSEGFITYLIQVVGLSNNTIYKRITLFKTFMHWATDRGYNTNLSFQKFRHVENKVKIITLTEEELSALFELDLSHKPALAKVRDVFCFGCYTGQRFSDVAGLQPDHVIGKTWHLHTQKTKDILEVPLNPYAMEILDRYIKSGKKLPSISNQKTNGHLKDLGLLAGIKDPITIARFSGAERTQKTVPKYQLIGTHTARRTFVTLSLERGFRAETVMRITGHTDYKTFKKYINLTNKVVETEMERLWSKPSIPVDKN